MPSEIEENICFIEKHLHKKFSDMNKLNLGCGYDYREGWVNADLNGQAKIDVSVDLNKLPLPFADNSFDYVFSAHTIEHVEEDMALPLMIELWRVLKPNGILELRMPHFSHYSALTGFAHKRAFSINSFHIFFEEGPFLNVSNGPQFTRPPYRKIRGRLKHQRVDNGKRMLVPKNTYYHVADFISRLANANTNFCEKIWCYWVGGFQEMQVIMQKIPSEVVLKKGYHNKINR